MKLDLEHGGRIALTHGAGRASAQLIAEVFTRVFSSDYLDQCDDDGAVLPYPPRRANLANAGKLIAIVPASQAENARAALRAHPLGPKRDDHRRGRRRPAPFRPGAHRHGWATPA
jgi:hydrogenase maturation factor